MAITLADFNKIWASTSPLTPYSFSEANYKQGWNFIGSTPPARQMWDFLQKQNDEKMQYIVNDICVPTEIDETSASGDYYSYPVPIGKVFANFNTLGGKTVAWNQMCGNKTLPTGITYTGNGTYTINGNFASNTYAVVSDVQTINGHKYYLYINKSDPDATVRIYNDNHGVGITNNGSTIGQSTATEKLYLRVDEGTYSSLVVKSKCIDLTLAFGSGNEPSTTAEVEALFPAETYPYNEGTLLSAGIKEVIAKDSSNNVVATMPIPSAVQSLEGYGWSAGSVYNYIDFERKVFVKRVGSVDLGSLSWTYNSTHTAFVYNGLNKKISSANILTSYYVTGGTASSADDIDNVADLTIWSQNGVDRLWVKDTNYTDSPTFKTAMAGVMLYYELATPVETDISAILGAVGIACGNTLTFNYRTDYRLPVPVSMDLLDGTNGLMTPQDKAKLDVAYQKSLLDITPFMFGNFPQRQEIHGNSPTLTVKSGWYLAMVYSYSYNIPSQTNSYIAVIGGKDNNDGTERVGALEIYKGSNVSALGLTIHNTTNGSSKLTISATSTYTCICLFTIAEF